MWKFVATAKQILWEFVELAFLVVLALVLIHLLLGAGAGPYVASVADNVTKFAAAASSGVLGIVLVLAIIYLVLRRIGWSRGELEGRAANIRAGLSIPNKAPERPTRSRR